MEFRFEAMLCSNLPNENSDAGHIVYMLVQTAFGPQVPHPWFK